MVKFEEKGERFMGNDKLMNLLLNSPHLLQLGNLRYEYGNTQKEKKMHNFISMLISTKANIKSIYFESIKDIVELLSKI